MNSVKKLLRALGRALLLVLRILFVLLLIVIPLPFGLGKPIIPAPQRRNLPAQVDRKR